jgi:HAD superfamily hydrolase (TIGR01459 family)
LDSRTHFLTGVAALARDYDGFIVDQWGVLHDGTQPYPGAVDCLEQLRRAGRHVVILSNSAKTEAGNVRLMAEVGFDRGLYDRFISAGEDTREAIERRSHAFHAGLGFRYFAFTRGNDVSLLEGIGLQRVGVVAEADFLAVLGMESPRMSVADYEPLLAAGAERGLPMVCANPDVTRVSPDGLVDAPGALARRYEALGGRVFYHGKPYPAIYRTCLDALPEGARSRVIAVGDSIEHDILGAARAGLTSAFVCGGIHAGDLGIGRGELPSPEAWQRFSDAAVARPEYLLPAFVW